MPAAKGAKTKQSYCDNLEDQITGMVRLDGTKIAYGYDSAGRLATLTAGSGVLAKSWAYAYETTHGQLGSVTNPDGMLLGFAYDGQLLQALNWTGLIAAQVQQVGLSYNNDFQIATVRINGSDPIHFAYDNDNDGLMTAAGNLSLRWHVQPGLLSVRCWVASRIP